MYELFCVEFMSFNHHDPCSEVLAQGDLRRASCGAGPASSNGVRGGAEDTTVDLVLDANIGIHVFFFLSHRVHW